MGIKVNGKKVAGIGIPGKSAYATAQEQGFAGTETELGTALAELPDHISDAGIHVTEEEKAAWNGKASGTHASQHASTGADPITPADIGAAEKPITVRIKLTASGWDSTARTQTVAATGVLADETAQLITPTPAAANRTAYYEAGILCTGQAADSLTFTADTVPTEDLTVYVVIQDVIPPKSDAN